MKNVLFYVTGCETMSVLTCNFTLKVRNAPTNFNESRSVAFCMYNLTLTVIVLCPLEFLVSQPSVKNIIEVIIVFFLPEIRYTEIFNSVPSLSIYLLHSVCHWCGYPLP